MSLIKHIPGFTLEPDESESLGNFGTEVSLRNFLFDNGKASLKIILIKNQEHFSGDEF